MGDHAYSLIAGDGDRGDGYIDSFSEIIAHTPWIPVIGNHEYYYGDEFSIRLMDTMIRFQNKFDNEQILYDLGLINPLLGKRGNLIIRYRLDLKKNNLENSKELIQQLFNT